MEVYTLDSLLRRIAVVDQFESLIWTDRYKDLGDFKITVVASQEMRNLFAEGTMLAVNESYRVMVVENVEDSDSADGKKILTITGRSLELILLNRTAMGSLASLSVTATWNLTGTPGEVCRKIFHDICELGILNTADIVPYLTGSSSFPVDTIGEPSMVYTFQIPPKSVYQAIKDVCDVYDLGFRLCRDPQTGLLHFDIYSGCNRTSDQTTLDPVIFSKELDNLTNTKEFTSIENQKNVAYVFSPIGTLVVYNDNVSDSTTGFDRKVLMVDASDLTSAANPAAALLQRGQQELANYRGLVAFDGEINQLSGYKYGVHYNVGDLVEQRNSNGFANQMRVTEQILTSDSTGERSYPTIAKNLSITPGSWISWDYNEVWADMGATEYWEDQV